MGISGNKSRLQFTRRQLSVERTRKDFERFEAGVKCRDYHLFEDKLYRSRK